MADSALGLEDTGEHHVNAEFVHRPVMGREVVELLVPVPPGTVIDATAGAGGHAGLLLDARPDLRLLGIDRDPAAVAAAREGLARFGERVRVVHGGFEDLAEIVKAESEGTIVGVLFDLGVSSPQLDRAERGFSYWSDAPLDMRMDSSQSLTAADVVNGYDESELVRVIQSNGEERFARRIAREIAERRPLTTTGELVDAIKAAIPAPARRTGGHPARRTFQAVRMEVNRELPNLGDGLDDSVHLLVARRTHARARVPLARGPHGEAAVRQVVGYRAAFGPRAAWPARAAADGGAVGAADHAQAAAPE